MFTSFFQKFKTQNPKKSIKPMTKLVPVVFSGPSGVGKSTLLKRLFKDFPDAFGFSVSHTTRAPRNGEENGVDYHFVTRELMQEEIAKNNFIEYAEFANKMADYSFARPLIVIFDTICVTIMWE